MGLQTQKALCKAMGDGLAEPSRCGMGKHGTTGGVIRDDERVRLYVVM